MSKLTKYRVIEQKLEQMPGPDVDGLWADMQSRLDHHMPVEQEKRRMLWWRKNSGMFLIAPLVIFVSAIFFTIAVLENHEQSQDVATKTGTTGGVTIADEVAHDEMPDSAPENVAITTAGDNRKSSESRKDLSASAAVRSADSQRTVAKRSGNTKEKEVSQFAIPVSKTPMQPRTAIKQPATANAVAMEANGSSSVVSTATDAYDATINVAAIMRKGLNNGLPTMGKKLVLLPVPIQGNRGSLFLEQPMQTQATAANKVPVPPAPTNAGAAGQPRYPSLNLATSLNASPFVLQQRELAVNNSMTFPTAAMSQRRFAFQPKFLVGAAVNMNLPVSSQEMSTVSVNGGNNKLFDYMPSVYVQYHWSRKLFVQTEFQSIAPQHTPRLTLASNTVETGPNRKQVQSVVLTKFYYMNLPLSVHYRVMPNLYAGAGVQYSHLTRSMLMEENTTWQNGINGWEEKATSVKLHVKTNPEKEKEKFKAPANPNSPNPRPVPTPVDLVAQKFRSNDLRFTYDLNYYRRRFNAGIRMNVGINNYIDTEVSGTNVPVRDRNKSLQLYIRYNLWEWKKH